MSPCFLQFLYCFVASRCLEASWRCFSGVSFFSRPVIHGPGVDSDHHLLWILMPFLRLGLIVLVVLFSRTGLLTSVIVAQLARYLASISLSSNVVIIDEASTPITHHTPTSLTFPRRAIELTTAKTRHFARKSEDYDFMLVPWWLY